MAVIRVNKTSDYTVMSNYHLKDMQLSLKAKGLLSLILSLPDNWNYTIGGLVAICLESESAVKSALNELKKFGYLKVDKILPNKENGGRYEYIYNIYEQPTKKQEEEKQGVENQPLENQAVENTPLYKDTDLSNTNKSNTKNKKKESKKNSFDEIITTYSMKFELPVCDEITDLLGEWLKVRKAKRAAMTDRAIQMNIEKLDKLALKSGMTVVEYLKEVICRGWAAFYEIKTFGNNTPQPEQQEQKRYGGVYIE